MCNIQDIIAALGVIGGVVGFTVGIYRYYVSQLWKKSELASKLLNELANDERLSTCCTMLDYSRRKMVVPKQYQLLTTENVYIHNYETIAKAMSHEADIDTFNMVEVMYRDMFDYYFGYLERINHYIDIGLISAIDVSTVRYWLAQIAHPRFSKDQIFDGFLKGYGYIGVYELMDKYNVKHK